MPNSDLKVRPAGRAGGVHAARLAVAVLSVSVMLTGIAAPGYADPTPGSPSPTPTTPSATPSATPGMPSATPSASPSTPATPGSPAPSETPATPATPSTSPSEPTSPTPSSSAAPSSQPPRSQPPSSPGQEQVPSADKAPNAATGPVFTRDDSPVRLRWIALGGAAGSVGALTTNERIVAVGLEGRFVGADILSGSAKGPAYVVKNGIRTRYRSFGGPTSDLGFPTSDEQRIAELAGSRSLFAGGAILSSASTGAHPVYRAFWSKFRSLRTPYVTLGMPTSTQTAGAVRGSQKQVFTNGTLLWTSASASHVVRGGIRTRYNALGAEKYLGVPLTDEYAVGSNVQQKFASGMITWIRATGATTVQANYTGYLTSPPRYVDARALIPVQGYVLPRVGGVKVSLEVYRGGKFSHWKYMTTRSDGTFSSTYGYEQNSLISFRTRIAVYGYSKKTQYGPYYTVDRVAWQLATVRAVTSADVRYTYRSGCPVGPSQLRVVEMNYYGFDAKMHRGMMIVRSDKVEDIKNIFWHAMTARFPIQKMLNPDVYKGSDPASMQADNTSAFNCRHVTGNPYRMSPHSYGYAFDVNTVENPYFDGSRWWPSNGGAYIQGGVYNRSPLKKGSLASYSALTSAARSRGWFWGGAWNPGRDWQHFEER